MLWHSDLRSQLPASAQALLSNQLVKLNKDWTSVSAAFPALPYQDYLYSWLIVNTRTFYYTSRNTKRSTSRDDCMALNPFADYFNHTDVGACSVSFSPRGYVVSTSKPIKEGEEICISYGCHSNDFLLAEYGFILQANKWDDVSLDPCIVPRLSKERRALLESAGYFGRYVLDGQGVCYRTQVALRMLCLPVKQWQRFVGGICEEGEDQVVVDRLLLEILESYRAVAITRVENLSSMIVGLASQRSILGMRWEQITLLLQAAIDKLQDQKPGS